MTTIEIEVKNILFVHMTSGVRPPEIELTDEQVAKIIELTTQLDQPWLGGGFWGMGPDVYMVHCPLSDFGIQTNPHGFVSKWENGDWVNYKDTTGVWGYLAPIGNQAIIQWREEQERYSKEYAEKAAAGVPGYIIFDDMVK
jgi:hypothetical protein